MGMRRKLVSSLSFGVIPSRTDNERSARNAKRSVAEARKLRVEAARQTKLLQQMAYEPVRAEQHAFVPPPPPSTRSAPAAYDSSAAKATSLVAALQGLAQLRDSGLLTKKEFKAQKARLLAEG